MGDNASGCRRRLELFCITLAETVRRLGFACSAAQIFEGGMRRYSPLQFLCLLGSAIACHTISRNRRALFSGVSALDVGGSVGRS